MSVLDDCVRLYVCQLGFHCLPKHFQLRSTDSFSVFTMSDFILIPFSDFSLLKHNTLMTLLSEFYISEIRQQESPVILGWLALQRLME